MTNAKFNITPLALPPLLSLTPPMTVISSVSPMKLKSYGAKLTVHL